MRKLQKDVATLMILAIFIVMIGFANNQQRKKNVQIEDAFEDFSFSNKVVLTSFTSMPTKTTRWE